LNRYQDYTGIDLKLKEFEDIENKIKEMLGWAMLQKKI
jgi:hypothetical protein